jgi:hypothetical protein
MTKRLGATIAIAGLIASLGFGSCGSDDDGQDGNGEAAESVPSDGGDVAKACATEVTVLFWPKGHPAIPAINVPLLPMPHIELYGGTDPEYPTSAALGWAFTSSPGPSFPDRRVAPNCLSDVSTDELTGVENAVATGKEVRLVCQMPEGAEIAIEEAGRSRFRFAVLDPSGEATAEGEIGPDRSRLDYSQSACAPRPPLKP